MNFPMKHGGSFHSFLYVYQRVAQFLNGWFVIENSKWGLDDATSWWAKQNAGFKPANKRLSHVFTSKSGEIDIISFIKSWFLHGWLVFSKGRMIHFNGWLWPYGLRVLWQMMCDLATTSMVCFGCGNYDNYDDYDNCDMLPNNVKDCGFH